MKNDKQVDNLVANGNVQEHKPSPKTYKKKGVSVHTLYKDCCVEFFLDIEKLPLKLTMHIETNKEGKYYFFIMSTSQADNKTTICAKSFETFDNERDCIKIAQALYAGNMTIVRHPTEIEELKYVQEQKDIRMKRLES